jgi:hypothetical protein
MAFEMWELSAREEIRDTLAAYNDAGDRGQLDLMAQTFAIDGVLEVRGSWRAEGRAAIVERLSSVPDQGRPRPDRFFIRHCVTNIRFVTVEPETAQTTAYFMVLTPEGPDHWGRYRDSHVLTADGWRIGHRLVTTDAWAPNSYFPSA